MTLVPLVLFAVLLGSSAGQVLELNDSKFDSTLKGHPFVLVDFFAPWCPYCKNLEPIYNEAAQALQKTQPSVLLAKVNCANNPATKQTCAKNKVRYLPWIVLFHNGKLLRNFGELRRDKATIVKFINTAVEDPSLLVQLQDSKLLHKQPKMTCDDKAVQVVNNTKATVNNSPAVLDLNDKNFKASINNVEYMLVDYYAPWCSDCRRLTPLYEVAAQQLRDDNPSLRFAKVKCDRGYVATYTACSKAHLKFFPWVVLYHNGKPINTYAYENVPDTTTIFNFIEDGMRGSPPNEGKQVPKAIRNVFKDKRKALDNINQDKDIQNEDEQTVLNLNDENFDGAIQGHSFVLVDFFAPWCFHCKKMAPFYDAAAAELRKSHPSVRLAKVDCSKTNTATQATCTKYNVKFLPTIFLFHNGKFVEEFDNAKRNKDTIVHFINDVVDLASPSKKLTDSKSTKTAHKKADKDKPEKILHEDNKDTKQETQKAEKDIPSSLPSVIDAPKETQKEAKIIPAIDNNLSKIIKEVQPDKDDAIVEKESQTEENTTSEAVKDTKPAQEVEKNTPGSPLGEADILEAVNIITPAVETRKAAKDVAKEDKDITEKAKDVTTEAKDVTKEAKDVTKEAKDVTKEAKLSGSANIAATVIQAVATNMLEALKLTKPKKETQQSKDVLPQSLPQVVNDLHQVAQDLHQVTEDIHKVAAAQQPAMERLISELHSFIQARQDQGQHLVIRREAVH